MKRRSFTKLILVSFWLFILSGFFQQEALAAPFMIEGGDQVLVDEDVNAALLASGNSVVVEGNVNGTTFVSGGTITINGDVDGTLLVAGQTVIINGTVNGTIFVAGQSITNNGTITGDLFMAGQAITLEETSQIEGSVFTAGQSVEVAGPIVQDLFVGAETLRLSSTVGRDANLAANQVTPSGEALIERDLIYEAPQPNSDVEAITQGEVQFRQQADTERDPQTQQTESLASRGWRLALSALGSLISASLIWWFLRALSQGSFITLTRVGPGQVVINILIGLAMVILLPLLIFLTLITLLLARIGGLLLLFYIALFLLAQIITASAISEYLVRPRWNWVAEKPYVSFIVTFFVLYLLNNIPYIGWFIAMISVFYAVGLVFVEIWDRLIQRGSVAR